MRLSIGNTVVVLGADNVGNKFTYPATVTHILVSSVKNQPTLVHLATSKGGVVIKTAEAVNFIDESKYTAIEEVEV